MNHDLCHPVCIVVVDPRFDDYATLLLDGVGLGSELRFLPDGRRALATPCLPGHELWLVSASLPDMAGAALIAALHERAPDISIALVGDRYCPEQERSTFLCGGSLYLCKPLSADWLPMVTGQAVSRPP